MWSQKAILSSRYLRLHRDGSAGINVPSSKTDPDFLKKKMDNYTEQKDPLEHETFQGWTDQFDINVSATFFMVRSFLDVLVKGANARKSTACVINISSAAANIKTWSPVGSVRFIYPTMRRVAS